MVLEPEATTSTKKAAKKAATKSTTKAAKKTASKPAKKAVKKTAKKSAKKTTKKTTKKKAAKKTTKRARKVKAPVRMKLIWAVGKPGLNPVANYAYKDLDAAEASAAKHGEEFMVMKVRVPMEIEEPEE